MSDKKEDVSKISEGNISLLMDVSINVTVELGRAKLSIKDILGLGEGSIIELQRLAGDPIDLFVNGKLIAKGEVVVIDESFGVRITDIADSIYVIENNNKK
ncbi:flagellar motor switch protein FliN [uncultured Brachyspira sp.]|uniref:flagellar motor switch protein FliN n=1 Tax=uncultured Brachyspira sp. TaxID=221953 RepID=UPI0025FCF773|nr:flagellar motor switch protein FliN [uncultured Brachyspira sp.]